jgi:flagellar L-ring protein precursor FlgH
MGSTGGIAGALMATISVATAYPLPRDFSLTGDTRSHLVDDVIRVNVGEANNATNDAQTRTNSRNSGKIAVGDGSGLLKFLPNAGKSADLESGFDGLGKTARRGSMTATVSARVVEVLANGTLRIEGTKQVVINEETEVLSVAGLVRPEDIASDNSVSSSRIADAKISYSGHGTDANAEKPGYLARFMDWLF